MSRCLLTFGMALCAGLVLLGCTGKPGDGQEKGDQLLDMIEATQVKDGKAIYTQLYSYKDNRLDQVGTTDPTNIVKDPSNNYFYHRKTHELNIIRVTHGNKPGTFTFSSGKLGDGFVEIFSYYSLHQNKLQRRQILYLNAKKQPTLLLERTVSRDPQTGAYDSTLLSTEAVERYSAKGLVDVAVLTYYSGPDSMLVGRRYQYDNQDRLVKAEEQFGPEEDWFPMTELTYHEHKTPFILPKVGLDYPKHKGLAWLAADEKNYYGGTLVSHLHNSKVVIGDDGHILDLVQTRLQNNNLGSMVGDSLHLIFRYRPKDNLVK